VYAFAPLQDSKCHWYVGWIWLNLIKSWRNTILPHFCENTHFITFRTYFNTFWWNLPSPSYRTSEKAWILFVFITFRMYFITFWMEFAFTLLPHFSENMDFVAFCIIISYCTCILSHFVGFRMKFALSLLPHFSQNMYYVVFCVIFSLFTCILSHFVRFYRITSHFECNLPSPFYRTSDKTCILSHFVWFYHTSHAFCRILYDFEWTLSRPFYRTSDKTCILSHFVWFRNISHVFHHILYDFSNFILK